MRRALHDRASAFACVVLSAACLLSACGSAPPPPALLRNEAADGPRSLATNCFSIEPAFLQDSLTSWVGLAAGAKLRWIEGGQVPGLHKGKAWPAVAVSAIQTGSLYERMGLRDGDIVYAFEGHSLYLLESFVQMLSDPSVAKEMDEPMAGVAPEATAPHGFVGMLAGSGRPDALALAVVRDGRAITVTQVLAGASATACAEHPPLREKEAEESTWTEMDWQAEAARAEQRQQQARSTAQAANAPQPATPSEQQAAMAGITKLTDTSFELSSSISATTMRKLAGSGARLVPAVKDGKPDGVKVYAVRPSGLYAALGMKNGDTLRSIAGVEVMTPEAAVEQLVHLLDPPSASIVLSRRGQPVTLVYSVK